MTQDIFELAPSIREKWPFAARYARVNSWRMHYVDEGDGDQWTCATTREGFRPTRRTLAHPSSVVAPFNEIQLSTSPRLNAIKRYLFAARPFVRLAEADGLMSYSADFGRPSRELVIRGPVTTYSADHQSNYCRM